MFPRWVIMLDTSFFNNSWRRIISLERPSELILVIWKRLSWIRCLDLRF